jgi:hypothetical protein
MSSKNDHLKKLIALTAQERRVVLGALMLLPMLGIGLRLFGFRRVHWALSQMTEPVAGTNSGSTSIPVDRLGSLVAAAANNGPFRASCLPRSLLLGWLLQRQGVKTQLRFGVRKSGAGLEAHAWVEHQGRALADGPCAPQYFLPFEQVISPPAAAQKAT